MIDIPKQIEEFMEKMSNMKFDDIYDQWCSANDSIPVIINDEYISDMIKEKQEDIGLNDKWKLGHFYHALWFHDARWLNVLIFSHEQAKAFGRDSLEESDTKLLGVRKDFQSVSAIIKNLNIREKMNITNEMIEDILTDMEMSIEELETLNEKPFKQKRSNMYIRKCEDNLWVEMSMQLEPSISETKQLDFMMKLMGEFKYDGMHIEDKEFKYDTGSQRVRLKKRRQRALKVYRSSQ